ncbi:glycosyl hydrolase family 61-domain-containing protein [Aspergillus ambiguus]|uniref:lytic polysaccharide monooxygenase auxiliary activity family 9 protein n=1 Tax=Aspergillus ambiguus TaxID=176160 RepID=UPI003CCDB438
MDRLSKATLLALLASQVSGHGHVTNIVINGVSYQGWDINSFPYMSDPPAVVAWGTPNTGNGFITPDAYTTTDMICHLNATNAKGYATVAAGDSINLQWTAWPDSHHGPVLDYLAACGDAGCETVDKTTLEFFKIDGVGLVDDTSVPGVWGDDQLIANNNSWLVQIPANISPGEYVLRHELIALHGAFAEGGAQNYMQCFNLRVTGGGSLSPSGVLATDLYTPTDPGILVDIYSSISYTVPGPTMIAGATNVAQATSAITATGTATVPNGGSASATAA